MKSTSSGNSIVDLMGKCPFILAIVTQRLMGNVVPHIYASHTGSGKQLWQSACRSLCPALSWEIWLRKSPPGVVPKPFLPLRVWCGFPGGGCEEEREWPCDPRRRDPNPFKSRWKRKHRWVLVVGRRRSANRPGLEETARPTILGPYRRPGPCFHGCCVRRLR